ncbi:MAG: hypothetical protein ABR880_18315 [Candidatus Sulfotelmatobacter sp.]|jgi:hypothetical protein
MADTPNAPTETSPTNQAPLTGTPATAPVPVSMISPDYSSVKAVPPDQVDDAKTAGWEHAYKMYDNQNPDAKKWVPASQMESARQSGWYAVNSPAQQARLEADAVKPSVSGNAAIMAAPLAVPAAVGEAGEALIKPAVDAVASGTGAAVDYAAMLGKEGVQQIAKMAAEHPKAAQLIARTLSSGVSGYAGEKLGGHSGAIIGLLLSHSLGL